MMERLSIDGARLYRTIEALGEIGAYDAGGGLRGVSRLALTAADGEGRRHVVERMRDLGLVITVDRIGNVFGRRAGLEDSLPPVMIGSHIDSVATAGRFDGCLGVLGGLEVVATLNQAGRPTRRPIVVAFFTEEEGARFGTDMLGSAVATGRISLDHAYSLRDRTGKSVIDELSALGFLGEASHLLPPPHAYLECHIEQGPVLRAADRDIGVVTGVQAICWHELTIVGKSAHAGTTPMSLRADPGVAAARINVAIRAMTSSGAYGSDLRATMGVITPHPGLINVVPARVVCTVDIRNPDDAVLERAEADVVALYDEVAKSERVQITHRRTARTGRVVFDARVQARVAEAATARGLSQAAIVSGAGHDAQEMAPHCPSGMVFVPGEYEGISHNPREHSTLRQCENGVNVLLDVALAFADEPARAAS
jgi:N-carbamoyl-L-amino-acid hydrolase